MTVLGCIADDFTGATDVAGALVQAGMRTALMIGVPSTAAAEHTAVQSCDAIVIALKSRSIPAIEAIEDSLAALHWLRNAGCRRYYFKYCSTFDSTHRGNIGSVTAALLDELEQKLAVICPAFPETGRRIFFGHLFVNDSLLHESGMERHPLNPMTDANLPRWLRAQTDAKVGLIDVLTVQLGDRAIRDRLTVLQGEGCRFAVIDAFDNSHLAHIAAAVADSGLVTGASGLASMLPDAYRCAGQLGDRHHAVQNPPVLLGSGVVLAGSCSSATRLQVAAFATRYPTERLSVANLLADPTAEVQRLIRWASGQRCDQPVLIFSGERSEAVDSAAAATTVGQIVEWAFGQLAQALVAGGTRKLIVAGGETSGAVIRALNIDSLRIGAQIAPGVPWGFHLTPPVLAVALKSGNFGGEDFFITALDVLERDLDGRDVE